MIYSFDFFGWCVDGEIPGRVATTEPPPHDTRIVGQLFPNWTGFEWVLATYVAPSEPDLTPAKRAAILAKFDAIDATTDKERTRRELLLGNAAAKAWLQSRDDKAADLRVELAALNK